MIQGRCRLSLAAKSAERGGIADYILGKELEGDEAVQARVFSLVNHAHPATTEFLDHFVVRDGSTDHVSLGKDVGLPGPGEEAGESS